LKQKKK